MYVTVQAHACEGYCESRRRIIENNPCPSGVDHEHSNCTIMRLIVFSQRLPQQARAGNHKGHGGICPIGMSYDGTVA